MFNKIIYILKKRGWIGFLAFGFESLLARVVGIKITKDNTVAGKSVARRVFSKCKIKYCDDGYYYLNPMPTLDELDSYYSSLYWESRGPVHFGISNRDIVHYQILNEFIEWHLRAGKVFLNFGAGHGGISNLFWMKGMDIINVEPSTLPDFYDNRWKTLKSITDVPDLSVDLLYGSHSLEHVQDIDDLKAHVQRILRPGGFVFWEVPNANSPTNGAQEGRVDVPHTYYFETTFFHKWFPKLLLCEAYDQSHGVDSIEGWQRFESKTGRVIRVLGSLT